MQQAEFTSFLRTILIILFIYYAFRFLARILAPYVMKKMVSKMQQQQNRAAGYQENNVREGETVIDKKPRNDASSSNTNVGEYVDFEEIE